jgi:hypothetical protein
LRLLVIPFGKNTPTVLELTYVLTYQKHYRDPPRVTTRRLQWKLLYRFCLGTFKSVYVNAYATWTFSCVYLYTPNRTEIQMTVTDLYIYILHTILAFVQWTAICQMFFISANSFPDEACKWTDILITLSKTFPGHSMSFLALPGHPRHRPQIQFRNNFTQAVGFLGRVINLSQGRYLNKGQGFEPTIPASERAKTVHTLDRAATVTSTSDVIYGSLFRYIIYK